MADRQVDRLRLKYTEVAQQTECTGKTRTEVDPLFSVMHTLEGKLILFE